MPVLRALSFGTAWVPAFAGMTDVFYRLAI
jgi:hypothetical protein